MVGPYLGPEYPGHAVQKKLGPKEEAFARAATANAPKGWPYKLNRCPGPAPKTETRTWVARDNASYENQQKANLVPFQEGLAKAEGSKPTLGRYGPKKPASFSQGLTMGAKGNPGP